MSNPYLDRSPAFRPNSPLAAPAGPPAGPTGTLTPEELQSLYAAPAAGPVQTGRLTHDDVVMKTAGVLGVVVLGAVVGWIASSLTVMLVGLVGGFVLAMINIFKSEPSPALILAYAACEGLFLGTISHLYNTLWDGVVPQALLGTAVVFVTTLLLYRSGMIRATARGARILLIALIGYVLFALVNVILMSTGVVSGFGGMYSAKVAGIPLALLIGILVIAMASYSFALDFETISQGVQQGVPSRYAWSAAFGLTITIVWLYLELLRLLAILRDS
jgi:uncharacterized YccA/Bax inhibitor family protein